MVQGMEPARPKRFAFVFPIIGLCLAGNGCLDAVNAPPPGLYPERLYRDSGDVAPTAGFQPAEYPRSLSAIRPSPEVVYWEMRIERRKGDSGSLSVYHASTDSCANRTEPCPGPLAGIRSSRGEEHSSFFDPSARIYAYFAGWTGTKAVLWNGPYATRSFLGRIDNETEALFWAGQLGYDLDSAYIRKAEPGYELLMDRLDRMCSPYRLLRVRVIMGTDGRTREIGRRTTVESFDRCLMN